MGIRNEVLLVDTTHEEVVVLALNVYREGNGGRSRETERTEVVERIAYFPHVGIAL